MEGMVRGWWQVAERVLSESSRDNLSVVAAGCAFYALFAIFPALSALISLYGLVADPANIEQSFGMLGYVLPEQAYDIVIEQIRRVAQASGQTLGWSLLLSLGLALGAPIRWPRRSSPLSISLMRSPSGAVFFNST
jgi:membrane protein